MTLLFVGFVIEYTRHGLSGLSCKKIETENTLGTY